MLSQSEEKINPNANRFTVRLQFVKKGNLQYISHLDLQRTFNRVIKRSGIPAWYTKGFNPHMKLVFSLPLSIGTQSCCEYLDLQIEGDVTCDEILSRLNREVTDELRIIRAYIPQTKFADIAWADYEYEILDENASALLAEKIKGLFSLPEINMTKNTKSGEKEINIIPLIKSFDVCFDSEKGAIFMKARLAASSTEFLNPEMLMGAMKEHLGVMSGDPTKESYSIMRVAVLDKNEKIFE